MTQLMIFGFINCFGYEQKFLNIFTCSCNKKKKLKNQLLVDYIFIDLYGIEFPTDTFGFCSWLDNREFFGFIFYDSAADIGVSFVNRSNNEKEAT